MGGPAAKNHAVVFFFQLLAGNIFSNVCIADKLDAGSLHDFDSSVDDALVQLHIRNAIAQQTADSVMTFIDRYACLLYTSFSDQLSDARPRRKSENPAFHNRLFPLRHQPFLRFFLFQLFFPDL